MIRIVIADDHAMFRQGLIKLLREEPDISVECECSTGEEAVECVRTIRPDVAVLDIAMPRLDGIAAAQAIADGGLKTKVIFLTMHKDEILLKQSFESGAFAYVLKDSAFVELIAAIRAAAEGKTSPISESSENTAILTEREQEIIRLITCGLTNKRIGEKLGISIKTADAHRTNIMRKLNIHTTAGLVKYAIGRGLDKD